MGAKKNRINPSEIVEKTAADGVITGFGKVNSHLFNKESCKVAIIINDFTVLAGTQGFFHHKKIDRIIKKATIENIPVIIFTEGGGGRPGDTDVKINNSWLDFDTFEIWAAEECPLKIAITNVRMNIGDIYSKAVPNISIKTDAIFISANTSFLSNSKEFLKILTILFMNQPPIKNNMEMEAMVIKAADNSFDLGKLPSSLAFSIFFALGSSDFSSELLSCSAIIIN